MKSHAPFAPEPSGGAPLRPLRTVFPWALLFFFALLLRLLGLSWGLPATEHGRFYHPDERNPALALAGTDPGRFDFNPNHAINPALFYYMTGIAIALDRDLPSPCNRSPAEVEATPPAVEGAWIRKGRWVSALLGAATPLLAAGAAGALYGAAAAFGAGFLLAVNPAHLIQSHYAAVDVPALAFFIGSLALALRFAGGGRRRVLYGSAFLAGLAVATKYLSGFVLFAPVLALLLRREVRAGVLSRVLGVFLAGLVLGFPAILDTETFFGPDGIRRLFSYYPYPGDVPKPAGRMVINALGFPLLGLAILGAVRALFRRSPGEVLLLLLLLFYALFLFSHPSPFHRHYLPLVAIAALFGGSALLLLRSAGRAGTILAALLLLFSLGHAIRIVGIFRAPDVREEAGRWIAESFPPGISIGVLGPPSGRGYYTAEIDPSRAEVAVIGYNPRRLAAYEPELFLLTDVEREVPLFTGAREEERLSFLSGIVGGEPYREARRFARPFSHGPVPYALSPLPTDYSYFRPVITVFERRPAPDWKGAYRLAAAAVAKGDLEKGKALLDSLLGKEPHLLPPRLLRAETALLDRSPPAEAILHLEKALAGGIESRREGPTHEALVLLHARRGEALFADSLFDEGRGAFRAALHHIEWVEENAAGHRTNLDVKGWKKRLESALQ